MGGTGNSPMLRNTAGFCVRAAACTCTAIDSCALQYGVVSWVEATVGPDDEASKPYMKSLIITQAACKGLDSVRRLPQYV